MLPDKAHLYSVRQQANNAVATMSQDHSIIQWGEACSMHHIWSAYDLMMPFQSVVNCKALERQNIKLICIVIGIHCSTGVTM